MKARRRQTENGITKALQDAIRRSRLSQRDVQRQTGVDIGIISRFLAGTRSVTLGTAERIAKGLGYGLRLVRLRKERKGDR